MIDSITAREAHGISDEDREVVEKIYRAIAGETDLLDEAVTPDWQDLPSPPDAEHGPAAFKPVIATFHEIFEGATVTIHEIIGCPGRAGVRAELSGVQVREWMGVPATNEPCTIAIHEFHHIEDGRVAKSWHMEDWVGWMRRAGAERLVP